MRSVRPAALAPLVLLAGFLAAGAPAAAQVSTGKITGVVTDQQTGQPLAGVQVFLEGTGRGALTGENGRYFILNIPPGTYTVVAQLIGYATVRRENVVVSIDVTRTVDFALPSQAVAVQGVVVQIERVPLIETKATGSVNTITSAELEALPVTTIEGALSLQQGFLQVPDNTNVLYAAERRRNPESPLRIRGGRPGETLTLIDGIPINNFVFGGPAFSLTPQAVQQVDLIKGGFEPQYGNALSGILNIVTKEGGRDFQGGLEYQTTQLAGALGSRPDELRDQSLVEGFLSGPVPGTGQRLRFLFAGRQQHGVESVYEFDDDVYRPGFDYTAAGIQNRPSFYDVFPGWRAFGFDQERQALAKLTFELNPGAKLNLSVLDYQREYQPFDFDFLLTGFDLLRTPVVRTRADSVLYSGSRYPDVVQGAVQVDRRLAVASFNQTLARTAFRVAAGVFDQSRRTCNFYEGFCLRDHFADLNFNQHFVAPGVESNNPTAGTDHWFGGERLRTAVARADLQSQITDHHNLQAGIYYEAHDLEYEEFQAIESDQPIKVVERFRARPGDLWNAAAYVQDKIEYDFLTVALGFRFDIGEAGGLFFRNPLDPNNGTTARTVCADPARFGADPNYFSPARCTDPAVLDSAAVIAFQDDLERPEPRTQFSPRISVSFPVTESSALMFNFGRYSQNPLLYNLYTRTFIGTEGEGVPCGPAFLARRYPEGLPGAAQHLGLCGPVLVSPRVGTVLLGNPNLITEQATSYELGYLAELLDGRYAFSAVAFSKDQFGLTGVREGRLNDEGNTYGASSARYRILTNTDFQSVRGIEFSFRRRLADRWGFDLNYSYSQARTNAAPPLREFQGQEEEGDANLREEIVSEIDRPHVFNGTFRFAVAEDAPELRVGDVDVGGLLRHTRLAVTLQASSGFPYTPVNTFDPDPGARAKRNSGRGPAMWHVDLQASKDFRWDNLTYGVFVRVQNLFDTKYCIQVFDTTGNCDAGAIDRARARFGNPTLVSEETAFSTYFDRPQYRGPRREINVGVAVQF